MSKQENGQKDEEEPMAQPVFPERGPDRDKMAADYLPEGDDWPAKTILDTNDPAALAALSQFGALYPEVNDLQPIIDGFTGEFLPAKTSIGGASRQEYSDIIKAMFGNSDDDDGSAALQLVSADD